MARNIVTALIELPERFIEYVDENVAASRKNPNIWQTNRADTAGLPPGSYVKGLFPHGAAYWTRTAVIQTEQSDGSSLDFFLKVGYPAAHKL